MNLRKLVALLLTVGAFSAAKAVRAQDADLPFLHPLFSDDMVLQRDNADPVWGWAKPGTQVNVSLNGKSFPAHADLTGKWMAKVGPFPVGGPYTLTVTGPETVTVKNVMMGDVWICSGQSNMEMGIGIAGHAADEIAKANYPNIRLLTVPKSTPLEPRDTVAVSWKPCTPATVAAGGWGGFSAAAYFFGREINTRTKVPIGLIHTSWGGTIAEAWTSGKALKAMPDFAPAVASLEQTAAAQRIGKSANTIADWWAKNDPGSATAPGWEGTAVDAPGWKAMALPQAFEKSELGSSFDGLVWFRKEIELPAAWAGRAAVIHLGPIDDMDTTWVNGVRIGGTENWQALRDYKIPAGILKAGRNVIAVRVLDTGGGGGLYGTPDQLSLQTEGVTPMTLAGDWQYRVGAELAKMAPYPQPAGGGNPNVPTVLYNGMIAPILPYGIKGAIWYQGESNAGRPKQYRTLLPTMITDWRSRFGVGDFPFYIVQLANYMAVDVQPVESQWAELREAQSMTAQKLPNSGIAVAIDIGDAADIHPKNKQEVGRRLALNALAKDYGQKVEYSGPVFKSMKVKGKKAVLRFDHAAGLMAKGDSAKGPVKLQGFAVAGADKKFVWADARIVGKKVIVSSPAVAAPVAVRYAWGNNPIANLYNRAGLAASPFRTDVN